VTDPFQKLLPDHTLYLKEKDTYDSGGILTPNLSSERQQTYAFDCTANGIGSLV